MTDLGYRIVESPVGRLRLVAGFEALVAVLWEREPAGHVALAEARPSEDDPVLARAGEQLAEYFRGARRCFDLPLRPQGTPFQLRVWEALREIPFGETRTYGALAQQLGDPQLARAVGAANGRNPLSIVVPCHRVIGAAGALTGFAGGLEAKAFLLALESEQASLFP